MTGPLEAARVLVVGGAGFVGGNLVRMLLGLGVDKVVIVDNLLSSERANVPDDERVVFVEGSIADDGVLAALTERFDYVWHLACYHGNQSSIADPLADHLNNSLTSLRLFHHLSHDDLLPKKLVYAAAGCAVAEKTFDDPSPTLEDAPVSMFHDSPYSISKIVGELYGNYFFGHSGLPFVKARFQNVYGPGEILGAGRWRGTPATVWRNVTPTFIWRSLNGLSLRLDNGGLVGRDFVHVRDVCRGLVLCALRGRPGEAYNLASGEETLIRDLARAVIRLSGSDVELEVADSRGWDASGRRLGSTVKARAELGFVAEIGLEEGISETIDWTRRNKELIRSCIERHREKMEAWSGQIL